MKTSKIQKFLYRTLVGRLLLKILTAPVISAIVGKFMDSPLSIPCIKPFIRCNNIDMSEYEENEFRSYNEFFTRKIKSECRVVNMNPNVLISPCDSKLTAYKINDHSVFNIKKSHYRIEDLLHSKSLAQRFTDGYCLIFRLEVDDYHRYCYIDNGTKSRNFFIQGVLHTVNPIALERYNIYKQNSREFTVLHTENFGDVVQVEVGAMMVGRICNYQETGSFRRGQEKGMFEFGGSTVVLLFEKDKICLNDDILRNSASGTETVVKFGSKIGYKNLST